MGLITNLLGTKVACMGLDNAYMRPLGYVVIQVQVDGVQGYDEDQIALVTLDLSNFAARIPVILGTLPSAMLLMWWKRGRLMPWANARVAHLLSVWRMTVIEVGDGIAEVSSPDDYDQVVFTWNVETIEAFFSRMVPVRAERAYTRWRTNVMTQALQTGDGSLLQGLTVQNTYTELRQGSKNAVVVVRNSMAYPQTLWKKTPMARGWQQPQCQGHQWRTSCRRGYDPQDPHTPKLTVRQSHWKLFDELHLSGLDSWPLKLADATC